MNWCNQCGHAWLQRSAKKSRECPDCQSESWDMPKIESRLSFDFSSIDIGQTKIYEWYLKNGSPDPVRNHKIGVALTAYEYRSKRQFQRKPTYQGLSVTRIA